jgi:hypothetical protein
MRFCSPHNCLTEASNRVHPGYYDNFWSLHFCFYSIFIHGRLSIKKLLKCYRKSIFIVLHTIINLLIYVYIFHRHVVYICTKIAHFLSMSVMLNIGKLAYLTTFDLDKIYDHKLCYTSEL